MHFYLILLQLIFFGNKIVKGASSSDKEIALRKRNLHETKNEDGTSIIHHKEENKIEPMVNISQIFKDAQNCPAPKENSIVKENGKWNFGTKEFTSKKLSLELEHFDCLKGNKVENKVLKKCAELVQLIVCFGRFFKNVRIFTEADLAHQGLRTSNFPSKFFANLAVYLSKATPTFVSDFVEFDFGLQENWPRFSEVGLKPHKNTYNAMTENRAHVNKPQLFWAEENSLEIKYTMETIQLDAHEDETHQTYFIEIYSKTHDLVLHKMTKLRIYKLNAKIMGNSVKSTKIKKKKQSEEESEELKEEDSGIEEDEDGEPKLKPKKREDLERVIPQKKLHPKTAKKATIKKPVKMTFENERNKFNPKICPAGQTNKMNLEMENAVKKAKNTKTGRMPRKKPVEWKDFMKNPIILRDAAKSTYEVEEGKGICIHFEIVGRNLDEGKGEERHLFWTHKGRELEDGGRMKIISKLGDNGGKWTKLIIKKAEMGDDGNYILAIKNSFGSDCHEIILKVRRPGKKEENNKNAKQRQNRNNEGTKIFHGPIKG